MMHDAPAKLFPHRRHAMILWQTNAHIRVTARVEPTSIRTSLSGLICSKPTSFYCKVVCQFYWCLAVSTFKFAYWKPGGMPWQETLKEQILNRFFDWRNEEEIVVCMSTRGCQNDRRLGGTAASESDVQKWLILFTRNEIRISPPQRLNVGIW